MFPIYFTPHQEKFLNKFSKPRGALQILATGDFGAFIKPTIVEYVKNLFTKDR